jgi:RNA recognition motif-containing protein
MDYGYQPFDGNQFQGGFPGIDVVQDVVPAAVEEEAAPAPVEETPTPSGELSNGRLYVGNLSWNVAWQDLKDYFKSCGHVVRADVMTGSDGRSRGW